MLLKDLFKSQLPKTLTEYQLGTELYWWLRRFPPEVERVEQLMALAVIPIVADESESWLAAQSQHLRVTIADAAKALDSVRSTPALRLDVLARTLREHDAEEEAIERDQAALAMRIERNEDRLRQCAAALYMRAPSAETIQLAVLTLKSRLLEIDAGKARAVEALGGSIRAELAAGKALKAHVYNVLGAKAPSEEVSLLASNRDKARQDAAMRQAAEWIDREERKSKRRDGQNDA